MKKIFTFLVIMICVFAIQTVQAQTTVCTDDAKLCPDGVTYVGRTGPSCSFAACPTTIGDEPPVTISPCVDIKNNLYLRSTDAQTGGEVSLLQDYLSPRYFNQEPTGYFGNLTFRAVQAFQRDNGIRATGYVGSFTRAKLKQLTCGTLSQVLEINNISPSVAKVGERVILDGVSLNTGGDYVLFDGYYIEAHTGLSNRIAFSVPQYLSSTINCIKAPCPDAPIKLVTPGTYSVQVVNNLGRTNTVTLTVRDAGGISSDAPKISFFSPSASKVNEKVVVYGYNFLRPETKLLFDGMSIAGTPVYSKRVGNFNSAFEFTVPSYTSRCTAIVCTDVASYPILPGTHEIAIENKFGRDASKFEVLGGSTTAKPYLNYVNPVQAVVGAEVIIVGSGLKTGSEKIYFGNSEVLLLIPSLQDKEDRIRFKVPEYITPCGYEDNIQCRMQTQLVTPGKYEIIVKNNVGLSNTVSFVVTDSGTNTTPKINTLSPATGVIGTEVIIGGERINVGGDKIYFGGALVLPSTTASADIVNVLQFKVPEYITPCGVGSDGTCKIASRQVTPGSYEVVVVNSNGVSNAIIFTVRSQNGSPVISGVSGPQTLRVNQQGTWTVSASNANGGNLSYSVVWGDEGIGTGASNTSSQTSLQQTATFTKSYARLGTYTPRFTVTNSSGQSVSTGLSVTVQNANTQAPTITKIIPSAGTVGTLVTLKGVGFYTGEEKLYFGGRQINYVYPATTDRSTMQFIVPATYNPLTCIYTASGAVACPSVFGTVNQNTPLEPGAYKVHITNRNGNSNEVTFNVISFNVENPLISKFRVEDVATINSVSRKLVWITQFTSSCTASGAWSGTQPTNGSYSIGFLLQPFTYTLTCVNSQGVSVSSSVTEPTGNTTQVPIISSINPSFALVGTEIALSGERLNTGSPKVIFGNGVITPSSMRVNDSTLFFTIPSAMSRYCAPGLYCTDDLISVTPGSYPVKVMNSFGTSNTINVIVAAPQL